MPVTSVVRHNRLSQYGPYLVRGRTEIPVTRSGNTLGYIKNPRTDLSMVELYRSLKKTLKPISEIRHFFDSWIPRSSSRSQIKVSTRYFKLSKDFKIACSFDWNIFLEIDPARHFRLENVFY